MERKIRDLGKGGKGNKFILERAADRSYSRFIIQGIRGMDSSEEYRQDKRSMEVDQVPIKTTYFDALWEEQEYDEVKRTLHASYCSEALMVSQLVLKIG